MGVSRIPKYFFHSVLGDGGKKVLDIQTKHIGMVGMELRVGSDRAAPDKAMGLGGGLQLGENGGQNPSLPPF